MSAGRGRSGGHRDGATGRAPATGWPSTPPGTTPSLRDARGDATATARSPQRRSTRCAPSATASGWRPAPAWNSCEGDGGVFTGLLDRFGGAYGRVEGAPWTAAFVGPKGSETQVGYVGEAFILEATRLGLGTCWVAGMFDRETAARLVKLHRGEHVVAVTPVGHPVERKQLVERMMSKAVRSAARRQVEDIAPGLSRGLGHAGRGAGGRSVAGLGRRGGGGRPRGAVGRQPAALALSPPDGALVMSRAEKTYWTAPIDFGIAMLHVELGAAHEGVHGDWDAPQRARRRALRPERR